MERTVKMRMNVAQEIMIAISMRHVSTESHHILANVRQDLVETELLVQM